MTDFQTAPYGAWVSPITPDLLIAATVRLSAVAIDGGDCYWLEGRPTEGGRNVLVRRGADGQIRDLTPAPFNVRSRAHEYGGGAYTVSGGRVWFCNDADQCIYCIEHDLTPRRVTAPGSCRYADLLFDPVRERLIAVREAHREGQPEPINELVDIRLETGEVRVLSTGHDFYASPALDPSSTRLAWVTWDHPHMPWVSSTVRLAEFDSEGGLGQIAEVAGGPAESVFQPTFSPAGVLYLVSDRSGWWNLYRLESQGLKAIASQPAEFARPQWQFGMRTFGFASPDHIVGCRCELGIWTLFELDTVSGEARDMDCGLSSIDALAMDGKVCLLLGGSPRLVSQVMRFDLEKEQGTPLRRSADLDLDDRVLSFPQAITFPTGEGEISHGFLYHPRGLGEAPYGGPAGTRPPLLVVGHGGPTGATSPALDLRLQYWTSRGFAVLDVNYRGSTGYGRAYRDRLAGQWGVADVEDCVAGARHVAQEGFADEAKLAIRGGSAGGYTALAGLCFHDVFSAGASYYGISELEALARDTHKFESRYLDWLIGPYPQTKARYVARSPIHHVDQLSCPVIFFQGLEDKVVPPNQAQMMVDALDRKGLPVAYLAFEGEQHGFRLADTVRRTLDAELYFYGRIFGFEPPGSIEPVPIKNLSTNPPNPPDPS